MSGRAPPSPRDPFESFGTLIPRVRGVLWVGGLALGLGLLGTAARVLTTKRLYRSEATVNYEPGVLQGDPELARQVGPHLREMLTASPRLQRLIDEMGLAPAVGDRRGLASAVDQMRSHVAIVEVKRGGSTTFDVSYDDDDADRARAVLARLVGGVVDEDTERRQHEAETARQGLDDQRRQADRDLETKEAQLAEFSAAHPRLASAGSVPDHNRAADSAAEIASLGLRAAELEQKIAQASGRPRPAAVGGTPAADPMIVEARAQVAASLLVTERDLDDKQTRLPYQHPDVLVAMRRVADARAALRKADAAVVASLAAAAAPVVAKASSDEKLTSLQRALADVRSRIDALRAQSNLGDRVAPPSDTQGRADTVGARLAREIAETRERRRQIEAKLFQAQLLATLGTAGQGGGLVVSESSYKPSRPIAGHRSKVALTGAALSVLLALLALIVATRLDGHLYDPRDVARVLGPTVVVVVPKLGLELAGRSAAQATDRGA